MADGVVVPLRGSEQKPSVERYRKMFDEAREASEDNRVEAQTDRDYYDGTQWTAEERATLARRKQPVQTYNLVRVAINGMVGIVERSQSDPKAWSRGSAPDDQAADLATKSLRYVADQNRLDRLKVKCARDYFVEGVTAVIVEVEEEQPDYAIKIKRVPWKELFFDPFSQEEDFSDARYLGVAKWMDQADVLAMYPDSQTDIEGSYEGPIAQSATFEDRPNRAWADRKRKRLMVVELYHKEKGQWMRCVFVRGGVLEFGPSAYLDDRKRPMCPIEAQSFAKNRDNLPYGAVRDLRSPQDGYNRRQSKLLHMLNVRQTFGSKAAIKDVDAVKAELARPDGHVEMEFGEFGKDFGVVPVADQIAGQFQLLVEARMQMERLLPSKGVVGRQSQDNSGVAIARAQDAGMTELADPFGGLSDWELRVLRQVWSRCKQFWTAPRWVRVSDDMGAPEYLQINGPEGQSLGEVDVDITLDVEPEHPTQQAEEFATLGELVKSGVQIPPEAIVQASSLRNKAGLVKKIEEARQQAAQQPNPEILKLQGDAAAKHEDQQIERERLDVERQKLAATGGQQSAQFEAERMKMEAERQKAADDHARAMAQMEIERQKAADAHMLAMAELELKRAELAAKAAEMDLKRYEADSNERVEMARVNGDMQARQFEASKPAPEAKAEKPDRSGEAIGKGLEALAAAMSKPKTVVRGPDGRAAGIE